MISEPSSPLSVYISTIYLSPSHQLTYYLDFYTISHYYYFHQWDVFMSQVLKITTRVPYMTSPGNHERDYPNSGSFYNGTDSGGECGMSINQLINLIDL